MPSRVCRKLHPDDVVRLDQGEGAGPGADYYLLARRHLNMAVLNPRFELSEGLILTTTAALDFANSGTLTSAIPLQD